MGYSFEYQRPVREVVGDRLLLTMIVSFATIIFTWIVAFPIGIYSATHQYSWGDYGLTFLGPPRPRRAELPAGAGASCTSPISGSAPRSAASIDPQYLDQPMSWAKFRVACWSICGSRCIIIGAGRHGRHDPRGCAPTCSTSCRSSMYVTARAKGLHPFKALVKYPLRMSLNFFISDIGSHPALHHLGCGGRRHRAFAADDGPLLIRALQSQDMYLAGSFLMFLSFLTVIGVLISDIALALSRPAHPPAGAAPKMTADALQASAAGGAACPYGIDAPFEPVPPGDDARAGARCYLASQWRLMWWKFRRHRLARCISALRDRRVLRSSRA